MNVCCIPISCKSMRKLVTSSGHFHFSHQLHASVTTSVLVFPGRYSRNNNMIVKSPICPRHFKKFNMVVTTECVVLRSLALKRLARCLCMLADRIYTILQVEAMSNENLHWGLHTNCTSRQMNTILPEVHPIAN